MRDRRAAGRGATSTTGLTSAAAVEIREAALGAKHPDVAVTLTYLGTVLRRCGDPEPARGRQVLERAREVLERAREINTAAYGLQDWKLAVTLGHLGDVFRQLDDLTETRAARESAFAIRQSVYPGQHPEVAFAFRDLGRTLQDAGDVAGALPHGARARDFRGRLRCRAPGDRHQP